MSPGLLPRLRCEVSADHHYQYRWEFCAHGPTVHTHFVSRCARCGRSQGEGETLATALLALAVIVLVFTFAFVLVPALSFQP